MEESFLLFVAMFTIALSIRNVYEVLKESEKIVAGNKPAFIVVLIAMCTLWISWFRLCIVDPFMWIVPGSVRWIGLAITGVGTMLAVGALIQLRGLEGIDHLVTRGLFRRIRHPMYLGFMMWIIGWAVAHGAVGAVAPGALGVISILWWRHLEDRRLERQFGGAYREYRQTTWC